MSVDPCEIRNFVCETTAFSPVVCNYEHKCDNIGQRTNLIKPLFHLTTISQNHPRVLFKKIFRWNFENSQLNVQWGTEYGTS